MKRYKLKKDLPTFRAGDIFYLSDVGNLIHESDNVPAYSWSTIDKFPNILTEWFEEINESTRWKPENGERYYYIGNGGGVCNEGWIDCGIDKSRFNIGNYFKTREEAERVAEYLKSLAIVRGDSMTKFVKGKRNWYVYYDAVYKWLDIVSNFSDIKNGIFGLPYFATEEDAKMSIDLHKSEWLTIFGVEEEK